MIAQVAKLVDALCSGRSARKGMLVRIQSWAPTLTTCLPAYRQAFLFLSFLRISENLLLI